jgi:hypothetical protein
MNVSINGILLRRITSRKITTVDHGTTLYSFRVAETLLELEAILTLEAPPLLMNKTVEGKIVH